MAKLRLGVIGAGSWTVSSHLPNLRRHRDEVEFAIVNRRNPELLAEIQADWGFAKASTDWHEVIAEKPDIVVVGSPPGYHWEQAKAALEAGAHVMCEKPFTIDPAHAWDLDETARRTGKQLFLSYGWNYRPMVIAGAPDACTRTAASARSSTSRCTWTRSPASCCPRRAPIPVRARVHPAARHLVAPRDLRRRLRPGPADPPAGRLAVADRAARAGRVRVHVRPARRQGGAPRRGRDPVHERRDRHDERRVEPPRRREQPACRRGPRRRLEGHVPPRPARQRAVALSLAGGRRARPARGRTPACTTASDRSTRSSRPAPAGRSTTTRRRSWAPGRWRSSKPRTAAPRSGAAERVKTPGLRRTDPDRASTSDAVTSWRAPDGAC